MVRRANMVGVETRNKASLPRRGKKVQQPAQLIKESGLAFYINAKILHPCGLAAQFVELPEGRLEMVLFDHQHHPDVRFNAEEYQAGLARWQKFFVNVRQHVRNARIKLIGEWVQEPPKSR